MNKESFEIGFVKAALDSGMDIITSVAMLKDAQQQVILEKLAMDPRILAALAGGGLGGLGGALSSKDHKMRNALIGGGLGAGAGALIGNHSMPNEEPAISKADQGTMDLAEGNGPYSSLMKNMQAPSKADQGTMDLAEGNGPYSSLLKNIQAPSKADQGTMGLAEGNGPYSSLMKNLPGSSPLAIAKHNKLKAIQGIARARLTPQDSAIKQILPALNNEALDIGSNISNKVKGVGNAVSNVPEHLGNMIPPSWVGGQPELQLPK